MAGQSSAASSRTGNNPFLRAVAALSTLAGWCSAAMIVAAVAITCQMIFVRFVLNQSTVWQRIEPVNCLANRSGDLSCYRSHLGWPALRAAFAGACER